MTLSKEQLTAFDEQGYVFFPNCFSGEEIALLRVEADNILDQIVTWRARREDGSGESRLALKLCGEVVALKFTEKHLLDLQEIIAADEGADG